MIELGWQFFLALHNFFMPHRGGWVGMGTRMKPWLLLVGWGVGGWRVGNLYCVQNSYFCGVRERCDSTPNFFRDYFTSSNLSPIVLDGRYLSLHQSQISKIKSMKKNCGHPKIRNILKFKTKLIYKN